MSIQDKERGLSPPGCSNINWRQTARLTSSTRMAMDTIIGQEWQAGTVPTNSQSALKIVSVMTDSNGLALSWQSVTGKVYCIQRSANPAPPWLFITIQSNVAATTTNTIFTDGNFP